MVAALLWVVVFAFAEGFCFFTPPTQRRRRSQSRSQPLSASTLAMMGGDSSSSSITFSKYQGLGNDFILVDARESAEPTMTAEQAARLCDRNFGVGGDGVIFVLAAENGAENSFKMRIINSDASEPEMCGNGIRCLSQFLGKELGVRGTAENDGSELYRIETGAGVMIPKNLPDGRVAVDMGEPELRGPQVPTTLEPNGPDERVIDVDLGLQDLKVTAVSMGNPHAIAFVDDVDSIDLNHIGPQCEHHPAFPARVNTEFVQVIDRKTLKMVVWERGAGATKACGTGACAVAVAAALTDRADRICTVQLPGGDLDIEWRSDDNRLVMTGPAQLVFTGTASLSSEAT